MEVAMFKALAHPIRLKIVKKLINGELCVCDLNEDVDFTQSNLSQHLKILKDANILIQRRDGLKILYSIKNPEILDVIKIIENIILKEITNLTKKIGG